MDLQYQQEEQIDSIKKSKMDIRQKNQSILESRRSFLSSKKKNPSIKTILATANNMIGSGCLVQPLIFNDSGIFTSLIVMVILGIIQAKTCQLILVHGYKDEGDFTQIIERLLGRKWANSYSIGSGFLLFMVSVIYFQLMSNMIYPIFNYFIHDLGSYEVASRDIIAFNQFSFQYCVIISLVICVFLINLKNLNFLIKLGFLGFLSLVMFSVYILYIFITNVSSDEFSIRKEKIVLFNGDFINIAQLVGTFCLNFQCHNSVVPIYRLNHDQKKNSRDCYFAFIITGVMYFFIGTFGCLGIVGLSADNPNTVVDYIKFTPFITMIVELIFMSHLVAVLPILFYLSQKQLLEVYYGLEDPPKFVKMAYSVLSLIIYTIVGIFNIKPTIIIAFTGAFMGFFLAYLLPILVHIKCLYKEPNEEEQKENLLMNSSFNSIDKKQNQGKQSGNIRLSSFSDNQICDHQQSLKISKSLRYSIYSAIMIVGFIIMVLQVYLLIKSYA